MECKLYDACSTQESIMHLDLNDITQVMKLNSDYTVLDCKISGRPLRPHAIELPLCTFTSMKCNCNLWEAWVHARAQ